MNKYRIIEVSDSHLAIETIDLYDPELEKSAQVIGNAIPHFGLNRHLGTSSDVKHLVPLDVKKAAKV